MDEKRNVVYRYDNAYKSSLDDNKIEFTDKKSKRKPVVTFILIVAAVLVLSVLFRETGFGRFSGGENKESGDVRKRHVGVLYVEGELRNTSSDEGYDYIVDCIEGMKGNDKNEGILIYVDTPGGGIYESDEVYNRLMDYKKRTKRPVYVYMASQAMSGGYYISVAGDKILANRNCWTGSIGVIVGTIYDLSGLFDKYGIRGENIVSGKNKDMGTHIKPLTEGQRNILKSVVDEAYEQFVDVVAKGRSLKKSYVRKISDGRIYTASQAKKRGLVDDTVLIYEDAERIMRDECGLEGIEFVDFRYKENIGLLRSLFEGFSQIHSGRGKSDIEILREMMEKNETLPISYISPIRKND